MKKVFRIWKYVESMRRLGHYKGAVASLKRGWPQDCEGKTAEEIEKIGLGASEAWMVEEDE